MSDVTQADVDAATAYFFGVQSAPRLESILAARRIAAEKAVLQNGVNCSSCGVRLPKDYEKPCPDCGAIDAAALADALETKR